jgi:hypothetical protein
MVTCQNIGLEETIRAKKSQNLIIFSFSNHLFYQKS